MPATFRVLAIHAHPDDVEFQCAGTLALLREKGIAVTIVSLTPGDCGSAEHDCATIAEIRRGEAQASAAPSRPSMSAWNFATWPSSTTTTHGDAWSRRYDEPARTWS